MTNFNNVTGDKLISKVNTKEFDKNYHLIFKPKEKKEKVKDKKEEYQYNFKESTDD